MNPQDTFFVRIAQRNQETDDIISLELRDPNGSVLPPFDAGAHIDVHVAPGVVRQYSLCNAPSERDSYQIGVLRDPASRGGSIAIHERLEAGELIEISAPRNHFPLKEGVRSILIAGGIGVTPMLCMAESLHASGAGFTLHYCARSQDKAAFRSRIAQSPYSQQVAFHYDDQADAQKLDPATLFAQAGSDAEIYVCGPAGFIEWICRAAEQAGIPKQRVHYEYFSAKAVDTSDDGAFDVKLASTGQVFQIPAERSITSVLLEAGIDIYTSCEEGTCGTCVTRILEGEPDHRDVFLTDEEHACGNQFTPCCSRAKSSLLVLDL
ncbi:vanillate O-demethylase oxidoreductase VanB (plasmid) [Cupriavidus necator N-1]|uniref:Vanillate O-demethylase oxidoreductase VanB n=1 Tax=Cupriavidus necator (strain ATCC 43291 / DSM 13513 / CCUG 52238 / LMG 8453 / N-1) TaxID=1042878 RepID=F8GU82_CUPNN|nr:PDR/VanB family oxidoreductase [Cupriavidus necator]AEI82286.1 vanillate O-demethylase oxidoreductase VanB [Cupriavidus necator N-1]MDX6007304.1 PDR/VanB family oxidoreductase [Cupriavidus necator]